MKYLLYLCILLVLIIVGVLIYEYSHETTVNNRIENIYMFGIISDTLNIKSKDASTIKIPFEAVYTIKKYNTFLYSGNDVVLIIKESLYSNAYKSNFYLKDYLNSSKMEIFKNNSLIDLNRNEDITLIQIYFGDFIFEDLKSRKDYLINLIYNMPTDSIIKMFKQ